MTAPGKSSASSDAKSGNRAGRPNVKKNDRPIAGEAFRSVGGVVLSALPHGNAVHLRIEFTTLASAERERLFAAVAKLQLEQAAARTA